MEEGMPNDLEDFHFKFKIGLVGDTGVGKTSFLESKPLSDLSHF